MENYEIIIEEIREQVRQHEADKQAMLEEIKRLTEQKAAAMAARQAAAESGDSEQYAAESRNVEFCTARIAALNRKHDTGAITYEEGVAYNERLTEAYKEFVHPLYAQLIELIEAEKVIFEKLKKIDNDTSGLNFIKPMNKKEGKTTHVSSFITCGIPWSLVNLFNSFYAAIETLKDKNL